MFIVYITKTVKMNVLSYPVEKEKTMLLVYITVYTDVAALFYAIDKGKHRP